MKEIHRNRNYNISFRVTSDERDMINRKFEQSNYTKKEQFLRDCILKKQINVIDISEITKLTIAFNKYGNNLNQIARKINTTNSIYQDDIDEVREMQENIWSIFQNILFD